MKTSKGKKDENADLINNLIKGFYLESFTPLEFTFDSGSKTLDGMFISCCDCNKRHFVLIEKKGKSVLLRFIADGEGTLLHRQLEGIEVKKKEG